MPSMNPAATGNPGKSPAGHGGPRSGSADLFDPARADGQPDYIIVYSKDGNIRYVNPAFSRTMGYSPDQMIGTPFLSYVPEALRAEAAAGMTERQDTREGPLFEMALTSANGNFRSVIVKGRPIRFGSDPATLLFLIDITRRKTLEDELMARADELQRISAAFRQANRKLTLLTTITRHDINNQLTVLKGYLELLAPLQADQKLVGYCAKAEEAAERIAAMIRFTREYEEIGTSVPLWHDARALVDAALSQAPVGDVLVRNDILAGMEIFADPLVEKVLYNLMDNAVRYGTTITTIRFSAQEKDGTLMLVCEDDGTGVLPDEKERIFERGFGKNTGLGLALSREILDITGITIRENGEPGKGARFEMMVPPGAWRAR
ncbi:MAG: PAS domain S-box protein [Methanomicrobiales archaeon]|nr:PAS domain S-box protein [Methanomicrobiales archaeon]